MQRWSADELREQFLRFFEEKGHERFPSASLVPHDDPTLLLTSAGMVPFKPYFLGQATPRHKRKTTCQRCVRTPDIDEVGYTSRHNTFFEMLGNFSFGDYFKREAIAWAWEFVTERMGIPEQTLWASVYLDDDEAVQLWLEQTKIPKERIVRLGKEDNFWEIGVGPCGPCSEIYIDRGEELGCGHDDCAPGCERCERFIEIWNLVFIQYYKDEDGVYTPLEEPGIDTGMGLERVAAILQDVPSNFDIDIVRPIVDAVAKAAGVEYGADDTTDTSLRVITDHMRAVVFLIFDGVMPGNEGRGYVLRRLLRRAARHGRQLGLHGAFLGHIGDVVIEQMKTGYPELTERSDFIRRFIELEEKRFGETLDQGVELLDELMNTLSAEGGTVIAGEDVFRLYDTYGFPRELSEEIARERGFAVDVDGFERAMDAQRARARAARGETAYMGDEQPMVGLDKVPPTRFVGYTELTSESTVVGLFAGGKPKENASRGDEVDVVLDVTPFYAEGGGQVGDVGTIATGDGQVEVTDVHTAGDGVIVHRGRVVGGTVAVGDAGLATVDEKARAATERHHTATHLLHAVLQDELGDHANQSGSLVAPDRLRFDFTHFEPLSEEQLLRIEERVNAHVMADLPVTWTEMSLDEARGLGAKALFGEKYGDTVRVVSIGDYSIELCGGTHVGASGQIGPFKIIGEGSVAAGVRRIEALAGGAAWRHTRAQSDLLQQLATKLQTTPDQALERLDGIMEQMRRVERERDALKDRLLVANVDSLLAAAEKVGDVPVIATKIAGASPDDLMSLGDLLRDKIGSGVIVLGTDKDGKAGFLAMVTKDLVADGVHAGTIVREAAAVADGGGGGQPHMARAGGKDGTKVDAALEKARDVAREQLQS